MRNLFIPGGIIYLCIFFFQKLRVKVFYYLRFGVEKFYIISIPGKGAKTFSFYEIIVGISQYCIRSIQYRFLLKLS